MRTVDSRPKCPKTKSQQSCIQRINCDKTTETIVVLNEWLDLQQRCEQQNWYENEMVFGLYLEFCGLGICSRSISVWGFPVLQMRRGYWEAKTSSMHRNSDLFRWKTRLCQTSVLSFLPRGPRHQNTQILLRSESRAVKSSLGGNRSLWCGSPRLPFLLLGNQIHTRHGLRKQAFNVAYVSQLHDVAL